jgi:hypothetical protein
MNALNNYAINDIKKLLLRRMNFSVAHLNTLVEIGEGEMLV